MLGVALKIIFAEQLRTVCYVERESYAASALVARMEDAALDQAPVWGDLRTFDGKPWRGLVEIITAGYPCQPFSTAGRRAGENDPRHLWPEVARITNETQPLICFLENVEGHLSMGFETVIRDLQKMGYRATPGLYTAAEVGASHRRRRLFILAYSDRLRQWCRRWPELIGSWPCLAGEAQLDVADAGRVRLRQRESGQSLSGSGLDRPQHVEHAERVADAGSAGLPVAELSRVGRAQAQEDEEQRRSISELCRAPINVFAPGPDDPQWQRILALDPTLEPAICGMGDGMANRVDRLRLGGNGVVPLAAAYAFVSLLAVAMQTESDTDLSNPPRAKHAREPRACLARNQFSVYREVA